jgi:hypothetical protein
MLTAHTASFAKNELVDEVKITIIAHPYLDDMLNRIRSCEIPWEEYKSMGLITEDEIAMIKHVENKTREELGPIMAEVNRLLAYTIWLIIYITAWAVLCGIVSRINAKIGTR